MEIADGLSGIWLLELGLSLNQNFDIFSFLAFFVFLTTGFRISHKHFLELLTSQRAFRNDLLKQSTDE